MTENSAIILAAILTLEVCLIGLCLALAIFPKRPFLAFMAGLAVIYGTWIALIISGNPFK